MWTQFKEQFYRDSAFSLVSQVYRSANLVNSYNPSAPISSFIQLFEAEWLSLHKLIENSTDSYRQFFAKFLEEDKEKRDFLLGFLCQPLTNVVDNTTTKDDLTFSEVKQWLLNMDHNSNTPQIALMSQESKGKNRYHQIE
ncbi:hypothetical protein K3495_g2661 [Podosphaera aphanis]|nr:hypothetical protein K3495_g2661 [Podosphaera aphanis]